MCLCQDVITGFKNTAVPAKRRKKVIAFRDLLGKIPWSYSPGEKRSPGELIDFFSKDVFLQTQEQSILIRRKSGRVSRRPAWVNKKA